MANREMWWPMVALCQRWVRAYFGNHCAFGISRQVLAATICTPSVKPCTCTKGPWAFVSCFTGPSPKKGARLQRPLTQPGCRPMTDAPQGRWKRAFDMAKVGARAGAAWAAQRGADAAAQKSAEVLGNLRGLAAKVGQTL